MTRYTRFHRKRRRNFPERYYRSLLRLFFWKRYLPPSVWKKLASALVYRDERSIAYLCGYIDGIEHVD